MPRRVFLSPGLVFRVSPPAWRALLQAHRADPELLAAARDPRILGGALLGRLVSDRLAEGLYLLDRLTTRQGRFALGAGAAAAGYRLVAAGRGKAGDAVAALVTTLAADGEEDPVLARALRGALVKLAWEGPPLSWERLGREARRPEAVDSVTRALERWAKARGASPMVRAHAGDDGVVHFAVRVEPPADAEDELGAFAPRLGEALLRVDGPAARLRVTTDAPLVANELVALVGEALFGERDFYQHRPAFTLRALARLGPEGLAQAALPPSVTRVRVIDLWWDDGASHTIRVRGPAALATLAGHKGLAAGYALAATLRLDVRGAPRPVDVTVMLPYGYACTEPRFEAAARAVLDALGVTAPGVEPDDLWTLPPFSHADWRWRAVFGDAVVDALGARRVLVDTATRQVTDPGGRAHGRSAMTFQVDEESDTHVVLPTDPCFAPYIVGPAERRVRRLALPELASLLRERLGLDGAPRVWPDGQTLEIGAVAARSGVRLRFFALVAAPPLFADRQALGAALRSAALPDQVVMLVPRGRTLGAGPIELEMDLLGVEPAPEVVAAAVALARVEADTGARRPGGHASGAEVGSARVSSARRTDRPGDAATDAPTDAPAAGLVIDGEALRRRTGLWVNGERRSLQDAKVPPLLRLIIAYQRASGEWQSREALGIVRSQDATSRIRSALKGLLPDGSKVVEDDHNGRFRLNPAVHVGRVDWDRLAEHPDAAVRKIVEERRRKRGHGAPG